MSNRLGDQVRAARQARRWSQKELAAAAGVAKRTIQNVENGHGAHHDTVAALTSVLGLSDAADEPPRYGPDVADTADTLMTLTPADRAAWVHLIARFAEAVSRNGDEHQPGSAPASGYTDGSPAGMRDSRARLRQVRQALQGGNARGRSKGQYGETADPPRKGER